MVNKHTVDYHPIPPQLTSRIHPLIFLWTISPEPFLNFFLNLYIPPWLWKSFKFMVLRLLANTFTHTPKQKSPPGFYHYPPGRRKLPIPPEQRFLKIYFSPVERGRGVRIMELKKLPKLNLQGYWSQVLISSTIFPLSVLLCHNLASSMLKCEGSLT